MRLGFGRMSASSRVLASPWTLHRSRCESRALTREAGAHRCACRAPSRRSLRRPDMNAACGAALSESTPAPTPRFARPAKSSRGTGDRACFRSSCTRRWFRSEICDASSLGRPTMAQRIKLPESCRKLPAARLRVFLPGDPGKLRQCPESTETLRLRQGGRTISLGGTVGL